jgi:adenosylcobinamide kinase/adenosylcobinamide-phosphate guanylyltransferase
VSEAAYPLGLRLAGRRVVVAGGGAAAQRQVSALLAAGARVTVVAAVVTDTLADLADRCAVTVVRRGLVPADLTDAWLVVACTDDAVADAGVVAVAESRGVWCGAGDARGSAVLAPGPAPTRPAAKVLVLGGARSGKSAAAEAMLACRPAVEYVATGPAVGDDREWADRVGRHRARRPPQWRTTETRELGALLAARDDTPVLVDCLSLWLAGEMDECGLWDGRAGADQELAERLDDLVTAWRGSQRSVVAVSSEVGSGVVPPSASGRRFRDELGSLNARVAAAADEVWLCVAGVARRLR